jgi:predicted lipoprotein with Yx(FWY)xxD motif
MLDGKFIASFGETGGQAGAFAGCCNPVYLEKSSNGNILTSEKGNPRISCYGKDGKFRAILFDASMLDGGTAAREVHVSVENIYIASKKTISVYTFDANLSKKLCAGCEEECPLRK